MPYSNRPLTVLVVDDDEGTRVSFRRLLKLEGYVVDEAGTVAELLDRSDWSKYFAVLLDRRLPDGTIDEVLPKLKSVAPEAAIVIVTGHTDIEGSIAAIRAGAADYLLKPVEPTFLQSRLKGLADLWRSRAELAERDRQMEFMVDHLPAAAAYVDREKQSVRFNRVIEDVTGYSPRELATVDQCFEAMFPSQAEFARKVYEQNRNADDWSESPRTIRIGHKDGTERTLEFRGYRYDDHEVWMLYDVTERDCHDTELRIRDRAIQSATEGIVIADATRDGHPIIFVNEAFQQMSGYSFDDAIGQGCELLCGSDPHDETLISLKESMAQKIDFQHTVQCSRKDGSRFWNELSVSPVRDNDGRMTHIVAVMEDVSDQRNAQKQLLQSERLAAIGQMVTGLAHESRNALQRARACLDLLSLDLEEQEEQLELTEKIRRALTDLQRHYEEVRNYAAPINLERRAVSLQSIWNRTWQDLEELRYGRDFTFHVADCSTDLVCQVDEHRIEQVFRNIMENAIAACCDPGRLELKCSPASLLDDGIRLTFHDNGPGFDNESEAGVFQPFYTTKQKGTGLGMAISKRIVDAHGGVIGLGDSQNGAKIFVELPRA